MATNYFRITAYNEEKNVGFIIDSHGMFDKLWEFSVYVKSKGCKIIDATTAEKFIDINTQKELKVYSDKLYLIACKNEYPQEIDYEYEGRKYKAIKVDDKIYIPNK